MPLNFPTRSLRLDRRHWLTGCASLAALAAWPSTRARAAAPAVRILERRVISHRPDKYHGWPTLARRKNGELLLVCSGGREAHVCPFGRVELMRSSDGGQSWSWPRVVLDGPIDDRDAGVVETARGTILITTFTSLAYEPLLVEAERRAARPADANSGDGRAWPAERFARWQAAHRRVGADERQQALGVWLVRSTDHGVSFSQPIDSLVNSPHGPIQLADGRLLYAGKDLWRGGRVGVCESVDDGESWRWLAEVPARDGDDPQQYHELHAVEAPSGRLIVQIRNHNRRNAEETLQCESLDGGRTWSQPRAIGVWGLPSHLLRLSDGRILMTYGYRRAPFGNQARISADEGQTWSDAWTLSDDGAGGDLGYPSTVQLDNGELVTVWYEHLGRSPHAVLRQARWSLEG